MSGGQYVVTKVGDPDVSDYEIEEALRDETNRRAAKKLVAERIAERLTDVDPLELARVSGMSYTVMDVLESPRSPDLRVMLDPSGNLIFATVDQDGGMRGYGPGVPNLPLGNIMDSEGLVALWNQANWTPVESPEAQDLIRRAAVRRLVDSWAQSSNDDNALGLALQEAAIEEFKIVGAMDWGYRKQWVVTMDGGEGRNPARVGDVVTFNDVYGENRLGRVEAVDTNNETLLIDELDDDGNPLGMPISVHWSATSLRHEDGSSAARPGRDHREMKFNSPEDAEAFRKDEAFQVSEQSPAINDTVTVHLAGRDVTGKVSAVTPTTIEFVYPVEAWWDAGGGVPAVGDHVSSNNPFDERVFIVESINPDGTLRVKALAPFLDEAGDADVPPDSVHRVERHTIADHTGVAVMNPDELLAINDKPVKWRTVDPWSEPQELLVDDLSPLTRDKTAQILDDSEPILRAFLRAQYDSTQDWLKEQGIDEIDLYRGMGKGPRTQRGDRATGAGITPSRLRPMSSWTTSAEEARNFGNATYFTRVPRDQIIGTPASGFGCLKETEIVILGHPMDVAFEAFENASARPEELPDLFDRKVVERGMTAYEDEQEAQIRLREIRETSPDLDVFMRQVAGMWEIYQVIKPVEVKDAGFERLHPRDARGRFADVPIPKIGLTFTHARHLDTDWKPGPGQRYADAPHRVYRVSRVTSTSVYFTGLNGTGHFSVDRDKWGEVYGGPASTPDVALIQLTAPTEKSTPDTAQREWKPGAWEEVDPKELAA